MTDFVGPPEAVGWRRRIGKIEDPREHGGHGKGSEEHVGGKEVALGALRAGMQQEQSIGDLVPGVIVDGTTESQAAVTSTRCRIVGVMSDRCRIPTLRGVVAIAAARSTKEADGCASAPVSFRWRGRRLAAAPFSFSRRSSRDPPPRLPSSGNWTGTTNRRYVVSKVAGSRRKYSRPGLGPGWVG
jgi:hypothetical protein